MIGYKITVNLKSSTDAVDAVEVKRAISLFACVDSVEITESQLTPVAADLLSTLACKCDPKNGVMCVKHANKSLASR